MITKFNDSESENSFGEPIACKSEHYPSTNGHFSQVLDGRQTEKNGDADGGTSCVRDLVSICGRGGEVSSHSLLLIRSLIISLGEPLELFQPPFHPHPPPAPFQASGQPGSAFGLIDDISSVQELMDTFMAEVEETIKGRITSRL